MQEELPRRYYDFTYLLNTYVHFSNDERKNILSRCASDELKEMIIASVIGAATVRGDSLFERTKSQKIFIDEKSIESMKKNLSGYEGVNDLAKYINNLIKGDVDLGKIYATLLEFEIVMVNRRLTSKK